MREGFIVHNCLKLVPLTGRTKANAVQAKAPERLMNSPNLGTNIARRAVKMTRNVRTRKDLALG